jgi:hypothetical protein
MKNAAALPDCFLAAKTNICHPVRKVVIHEVQQPL